MTLYVDQLMYQVVVLAILLLKKREYMKTTKNLLDSIDTRYRYILATLLGPSTLIEACE